MFRLLFKTLDIENTYTINSFIYILSKLPILKDLITNDIYKSKIIKGFIGVFVRLFILARAIFLKFMYYFLIFFITYKMFFSTMVSSFLHIYFVLTILGMFINNKLLNTNKKKYFSLLLFNMDATEYFRANIFYNIITNTILNTACITIFVYYFLACPTYLHCIMLIIFTLCARLIGEMMNIMFYRKYHYIWYTNNSLYFTVLVICIGSCFLPFLKLFIPLKAMYIITLLSTIMGMISLVYLLKIKDYRLIYKKLNMVTNAMDSKNEKDYLRQAMVDVREKDKIINNKKIKNKHGYDMFNTIFFERHKEILVRSARKYAFISFIVYGILSVLIIKDINYNQKIRYFLQNQLSWFVIIMFFINRGAIITQAMFFNCDHAMLQYNFYREPKTIVSLFKKRLITIAKVNLLPAFVIGIGNVVLLVLSSEYSWMIYITTFLYIILLSIFFSIHYLVLYYLLQPFNKNLEVKRASYSFATLITYMISYWLTNIVIHSLTLTIIVIIFVILYTIIALYLVKKVSPKTFKLK